MNNNSNAFINWIIENPIKAMALFFAFLLIVIVGVTGFWPVFSNIPFFSNITFGLYDKNFWENFLVEAHGFLLDFIIFGVIVFGFDLSRAKKEKKNQKDEIDKLAKAKVEKKKNDEIERMLEEISDYADLDLPEVNRKKFGHIKRLQNYKVKVIDVTQLTLNGCNVKNFTFESGSRLIGFQLQDGFMTNIIFSGVKMRSSNFNGSKLTSCTWIKSDITRVSFKDTLNAKGSKFIKCNMTSVDLRGTNLTGSEFTGSLLANVKFEGAKLDRADFRDTRELDLEQLSKAASLNYLKISDEQLEVLKIFKPEMKVARKKLKNTEQQATEESNPHTY